jgi:DNA-binding response OmpR family regulator
VVKTTGCKVQTAATGRAALAVAADFEPDVVFLDIGLPDLSGYEVARGLREKARRRFRLIALTGYGQPSDVEHAVSAGFDQLIVKPASLDSILAVIAAT